MSTMKEVARIANVHISTVSRVFSDHPSISVPTRNKVLRAAKSAGFHKTGNSGNPMPNVAGIIVPEMVSAYYSLILQQAKYKFEEHNFQVVAEMSNFNSQDIIQLIRLFGKFKVNCMLIFVDDEEISEDVLLTASKAEIPAMFITSRYFEDIDFDCLYIEERKGADLAVDYFLRKGYQSIGFIGEEKTSNRYNAFVDAIDRRGLQLDMNSVKIGKDRWERGGYLRMKEMLANSHVPEAIFVSYDQMALGALHAMSEAGLKAPEDIAIIGVDNIEISKYAFGGITSIANPYSVMISNAVRLLMQRINQPEIAIQKIALLPSLVVRTTA